MKKSVLRWFFCSAFFSAAVILLSLAFSDQAGAAGNLKISPSLDAMPGSGTLTPSGADVTWNGFVPLLVAGSLDESSCVEGVNCDTFTLTLSGVPGDWSGKKARVTISWANADDDFDVFVHKTSNSGPLVGSAASGGAGPEIVDLDPTNPSIGTGTFTVHVVYFLVNPGATHNYQGRASALANVAPSPTPTPSPGATPTPTPVPPGTPRFQTFVAPPGTGENAGEPSIGSNWTTENFVRAGSGHTFANSNGPVFNGGTTTYYGGFLSEMLRITFDDCSSPANAYWEKKPLFLAATPRVVGDPILFTDRVAGRTFVSQEESAAGSTTDVTDNDGDSFMPSMGAGAPAGFDHQTIASGPYRGTPPPTATWPATGPKRAVYYAAQSVSDARTSRSDDGGITFLPAVPMFTFAQCTGLHGHLKVAPDGTVYVPNKTCSVGLPILLGGNASVIASEDNGVTWDIRSVPGPLGAGAGEFDPSVGIAADGTVYLGYQGVKNYGNNQTGTPAMVSVSSDKGVTWSPPVDVGAALGIKNIAFPAVVAGDPQRAAFAFYGTTTADCTAAGCNPMEDHRGGRNDDPALFSGVWYLYVATTFDGGQTWVTQNVTPNDPIQRGPICGGSTCRNLLDFFDATIDKRGRILIGWEDGCIGSCVNGPPNSFTAKATISRQSGGKRMFAQYDPVEPALPEAPAVAGFVSGPMVQLSWPVPDAGGSFITAYKVYRRTGTGGTFNLIATVTQPSYTDTTFASNMQNYYRVTAVNAVGEGPYCKDFLPAVTPPPSPCSLPGIQVINDLNPDGSDNDSGQNTPVDGSVNIKQLYVAEPYLSGGLKKLFFTLQVAPTSLGSAPPNSQWFIIWPRQGTDPSDPNDSVFDRMYVAMRTDANGNPTFEYGKFGIPINTSPPPLPDPNANSPKRIGDADRGTYNPLTGQIQIEISNSKFQAIDGGAAKYVAGTDLAGLNVRTYFNRPDPGQRSQNNASDITGDGSYSLVGNAFCAPAATLVSAVSRKNHGSRGAFEVRLLPTGPQNGIDSRSGGANGDYQIVMVFAEPITFSGATTDSGTVASTSANQNIVTVNLTGVQNASVVNVALTGATAGGAPISVPVVLKVLIGDTNADGFVNAGDAQKTRARSGEETDDENFRSDVNTDGVVNAGDATVVRSRSGTSLP